MTRNFCVSICLLLLLGSSVFGLQNEGQSQRKVDLNTATVAELDDLPGIGPATAERIVRFRDENGPFRKVEDLMNVRGIGEKKFLKLKHLIRVGSTSGASNY